MEKKNVIDKRPVKLENVLKPGYIAFLEGRPQRDSVIGNEDLLNLKIVLETSKTVQEFIDRM